MVLKLPAWLSSACSLLVSGRYADTVKMCIMYMAMAGICSSSMMNQLDSLMLV